MCKEIKIIMAVCNLLYFMTVTVIFSVAVLIYDKSPYWFLLALFMTLVFNCFLMIHEKKPKEDGG